MSDSNSVNSSQKKLKVLSVKANEAVIREGDIEDQIYFLKKGLLHVYKHKNGEKIQIGQVNPGELFGEMAFIDMAPRVATIVAAEDSEVLIVTHESFQKAINEQPEWLQKFIRTLIARIKTLEQH